MWQPMGMQGQTASAQNQQSKTAPSSKGSSDGASPGQVQLKASLTGKSYDEQSAMLSPVQKKDGDPPAAPGGDKGPAPAQGAPAPQAPGAAQAPGATPADAPAAAQAPAAPAPAGPEGEIATAITSKRAAAAELVKAGKFDTAFADLAAYLKDSETTKPNETKAALATLKPTAEWLVDVVGDYLKSSPVGQEVLKEDKGPARGKDDKSAAITASFISSLTSLQGAVEGGFPGDSARAVKEITLRRELFKLFAQNHDKSQEESGIGSAQSAVKGKVEQHVTSCNAYQGQLLRQAFGNANAESSKDGGAGKIDIKQTTTYGWDMEKKRATKGPKQRNFGLYDSLGRAAQEVGAWTPGGPGLTPKAGDILIYLNGSSISHIGFFKFSEECPDAVHQLWHTFDGGQIAGKPMTGTAKGMVQTVQDGALNNVKRSYDKVNNTIETPSEEQLATLRGEQTNGGEGKKPKVNQDGLKRKIGGVIDIGKFIELDKKDEAEAGVKPA